MKFGNCYDIKIATVSWSDNQFSYNPDNRVPVSPYQENNDLGQQ